MTFSAKPFRLLQQKSKITRAAAGKILFSGATDARNSRLSLFPVRRILRWLICVYVILNVPYGKLFAAIDSGGGKSALGAGLNHSIIGAPFDTGVAGTGFIEVLYPPTSAGDHNTDMDADRLNDTWERQHFGDLDTTAAADVDGDGSTNHMEYLAGTDPRSADSVFKPTSSLAGETLMITVPTVPGRDYRVWGTANLQGSWTEHDTIAGDGSIVQWEYVIGDSPRYFLKIEILIPTN